MKKTILIIDDDNRNIFALSAILKAKGFVTDSATNMKEAFEKLGDGMGTGFILMDMMMPDMDGYEAIPLIKRNEQFRHIPVISVTAQAMAGDREKCLAAGADEYVSKPVDIDRLIEILKQKLHE